MTSIPASRRARAMILAPRSWPSRPTFATPTLIARSLLPILPGRVCRARGEHRTPSRLSPAGTEVGDEEGDAGQEEEHPAEQADHVPGPYAGRHKERRGDDEEHPSQEVVPLVPARTIFGHAKLLSYKNGGGPSYHRPVRPRGRAREICALPPELPDVVPEHVEADDEDRRDDELPEELVEQDEGGHRGEAYVRAADEVGEASPEPGLGEGEERDAHDEHRDQVLLLEDGDGDEDDEHEADAHGGPRLGHPAEPELRRGRRPVRPGDVGPRRVPLPGLQPPGVLRERARDGVVRREPRPEPAELPGELGDAPSRLPATRV